MKRGLILVLAVTIALLPAVVWAEFSDISMRLQGINPDLNGVVSDEYSDALSNPADVADIEGWRVYTNMSNLYGDGNLGSDQAFRGNPTGGAGRNEFLLGGFGNPLKGFLPNSQMGLLYNSGSNLVPQRNNLGDLGETTRNNTTQDDNNNDGDFNDANDWTRTTNQKAKREIETGGTDWTILYSHRLRGGSLKCGAGLLLSGRDIMGVASSTEPITASDSLTRTTIGTPTTTVTQNNSLDAKETNTNSTRGIIFGAKYQVDKNLDFGGTVGITSTSQKKERTSEVKFSISDPGFGAGTAANPFTATATAVDGNLDAGTLGGYTPLAGNVTNDFTWTGGTNWGAFDAGNFLGITGDEVGNSEAKGRALLLGCSSSYQIRDNITLKGYIDYIGAPQDLSGSLSRPYTETARNVGVANDQETMVNNTTYDVEGDITNNMFTLGLGGEAELKDSKILLGFGAVYRNTKTKTDGTYTMTQRDVNTYDRDGAGFVNAAGNGDSRETITDEDKGSFVNELNTSILQFPIGLEMWPWKRFAVRLGTTHQITTTKNTSTTEVTSDGLQARLTETNGTNLTTYEPTWVGKTTGRKTTTVSDDRTRTTQYYYGVGYDWSENVRFDILGLSGRTDSGAGILDIASWRIGCTLIF